MYSQYNSNPYQPLRADTGEVEVNYGREENFSQKVILKMINFN